MAGHQDAVFPAPVADLVTEGGDKPLRRMVKIAPAYRGDALRLLPDHLRQAIQQAFPPYRPVGIIQVVRPGQQHILQPGGTGEHRLPRHLGLVGEDCRADPAQVIAQHFLVPFMGDADKFLDGSGFHGIHISVEMEPGAGLGHFQHRVPYRSARFLAVRQAAVAFQQSVPVQLYAVPGQQLPLAVLRGFRRHQQEPLAVLRVLRHKAPGKSGGPPVLVVQPGQHALLPRLLHAGADAVHEFVAQVRNGHPASDMHVESAHSHLFHIADFPLQQVLVQAAVPGPEGRAAVFRPRVPEQFGIRLLFFGTGIQHSHSPLRYAGRCHRRPPGGPGARSQFQTGGRTR